MTDKEQIIINGVDVGECEYLTYQLEEDGQYYWFCKISPTGGPDECEYNPECFYKKVLKQLTRKSQECEKLKKQLMQKDEINTFFNTPIEGWSSNPCDICESKNNYEQLTQECDTLKSQLDFEVQQKECIEQECEELKKQLEFVRTHRTVIDAEKDRYRKALEEIEEIVSSTLGCGEWIGRGITKWLKILDIINKVKGEGKCQ